MSQPAKMTGREFVNLVCDALGLTSPRIRAVRISADISSGVVVEVEQLATVDEGRKIAEALEDFGCTGIQIGAQVGGAREAKITSVAFHSLATGRAIVRPEGIGKVIQDDQPASDGCSPQIVKANPCKGVREVIREHLAALSRDLGQFEQTTHGHLPLGDPISDVADNLKAAYQCPTAYQISNLASAIDYLVKKGQA